MWDQFLILPFDTKSHDKRNHTQKSLWSSPTKCLICTFFYNLKKNKKSIKSLFPHPTTDFLTFFSKNGLEKHIFCTTWWLFSYWSLSPKVPFEKLKILKINSCTIIAQPNYDLTLEKKKFPSSPNPNFEDTYYALNRKKKITQIFSFLVPKSIKKCVFLIIELWKTPTNSSQKSSSSHFRLDVFLSAILVFKKMFPIFFSKTLF